MKENSHNSDDGKVLIREIKRLCHPKLLIEQHLNQNKHNKQFYEIFNY